MPTAPWHVLSVSLFLLSTYYGHKDISTESHVSTSQEHTLPDRLKGRLLMEHPWQTCNITTGLQDVCHTAKQPGLLPHGFFMYWLIGLTIANLHFRFCKEKWMTDKKKQRSFISRLRQRAARLPTRLLAKGALSSWSRSESMWQKTGAYQSLELFWVAFRVAVRKQRQSKIKSCTALVRVHLLIVGASPKHVETKVHQCKWKCISSWWHLIEPTIPTTVITRHSPPLQQHPAHGLQRLWYLIVFEIGMCKVLGAWRVLCHFEGLWYSCRVSCNTLKKL